MAIGRHHAEGLAGARQMAADLMVMTPPIRCDLRAAPAGVSWERATDIAIGRQ